MDSENARQPEFDAAAITQLLSELFGGEFVGTYSVGEGGRSIQARVWVDGRPYLHVFERDESTGEYKPVAMHCLARAKL